MLLNHQKYPLLALSDHAVLRMSQRGINTEQINLALTYGRKVHSKGIVFRVIGKKEILHFADREPRLKQLDGLQVLVSCSNKTVITVYKNHDLRNIKSHRDRCH